MWKITLFSYSVNGTVNENEKGYRLKPKYELLKPTIFIQNCIYMNFRIHLTQFYINSKQEHQI